MRKNKLLLSLVMMIVWSQGANAQKNYDLSFVEFGIGQRSFGNVPTNIWVNYDTLSRPVDFGKGKPALLSLGGVFLPTENGWAGCFVVEGMVGNTSSFGIRMGAGYKLGNDRFSIAPMLALSISKAWNRIYTIDIEDSGMLASTFDDDSEAFYVGPGTTINGVEGENIALRVTNSLFDLRPMCYVSYSVSNKISLFTNFGFNLNIGHTSAIFEAAGTGYESLTQLLNEETPTRIITEIDDNGFLQTENGAILTKSPLNYSGFVFQIGIGLTTNK